MVKQPTALIKNTTKNKRKDLALELENELLRQALNVQGVNKSELEVLSSM